MTTVEFSEHVGPDKILHLNVPVDEADRTYRVIVLIQPQLADSEAGHAPRGASREALTSVPLRAVRTVVATPREQARARRLLGPVGCAGFEPATSAM